MPRLEQIQLGERVGCWQEIFFPVHQKSFREALKQIPGVCWNPDRKSWRVPLDAWDKAGMIARAHDLCLWDIEPSFVPGPRVPELRPYQQQLLDLVWSEYGALGSLEQGLGKTWPGLVVAAYNLPALVVAPAGARPEWPLEAQRRKIPLVFAVVGDKDSLPNPDVTVVSYEQLAKVSLTGWRSIIFDESHRLAKQDSKRSLFADGLVEANPNAVRLCLTGTPIGNRVEDLWHQLQLIWPGRFGTYWKFTERYCLVTNKFTDEDGKAWGRTLNGVNPETAAELRERLEQVSVRATKAQWAHLLPPFSLKAIWKRIDELQYLDMTDPRVRAVKAAWAVDAATELLETTPKLAIVCFHHEVADAVAAGLGVTPVGKMAPNARRAVLEEHASASSGPMVVTMGSIAEGINILTPFTNVLLAEFDYYPLRIAQALARFHRQGSPDRVMVTALGLQGTKDESIYLALADKMQDENRVIDAGIVQAAVAAEIEQAPNLADSLIDWSD